MWAGLLDLLFPPRCAGCGARGGSFCPRCVGSLHWIGLPVCVRCGSPRPTPVAMGGCCPACRRLPPPFATARSLGVYEGPLREAIRALKYRGRRRLAEPLGRLLAESAPEAVTRGVHFVVPVPLHPHRLAARGFNQSELLAWPVAAKLGVPCVPAALHRLRQETPQAELGAASRRHNVLDAFAPGRVRVGGTVLLIDDVFSTGSTAAACARALVASGASRVHVLTLARAVLRNDAAPIPAVGLDPPDGVPVLRR